MDKETLSNYGWIVIAVLVLVVMIALATPFGTFVSDAVKSTTQGLFDTNQNALDAAGIVIDDNEFDKCNHDYEVTTTANCTVAGTTTYTCKLCDKTYSEETPASHVFDNATDMTCNVCDTRFNSYHFTASDYDAKMGTTTSTDAVVVIPETFEYNGSKYKVTDIYSSAFENCKSLQSITLPNSIIYIRPRAFYNCSSLTKINIPDSVTHIQSTSFHFCTSLESIIIPDSVISISDNSFGRCPNLKTITIPSSITKIEYYTFFECKTLENIIFGGTTEQWNALEKVEVDKDWNMYCPEITVTCTDGKIIIPAWS